MLYLLQENLFMAENNHSYCPEQSIGILRVKVKFFDFRRELTYSENSIKYIYSVN